MAAGAVSRDEATAAFFDAAARGEFLLRRCTVCGSVAEPYRQRCPQCESAALGWQPAAGGARLVSWSVVHGRPGPDGGTSRTVAAIAVLDEGPWWWAELVDADPATLRSGQPLRISFEQPAGSEPVPVFRAG